MNKELDLRALLSAMLGYWRIIAVVTLLVAGAAVLLALLSPRPILASANVLISPNSEQISLDPRYINRDATLLTNSSFQRQALIALASSVTVEARVAEALRESGQATTYVPGALLNRISVVAQGDLVQIIASGNNAQSATQLADTWGKTYQQIVSEVYSRDGGDSNIDAQVESAKAHYNESQKLLEDFLVQSDQVAVDQQILRVSALLDGSRMSGELLYNQYLTRTHELDLILSDSRTLREQVASGTSSDLSDSLTLLALRARISGGAVLPVQLRFDDPTRLAQPGQATLADLDSLIAILERELVRQIELARTLADTIVAGDDSAAGLLPEVRATYERTLSELNSRSELLSGKKKALTQQRDVALNALELLLRKSAEEEIAQTVPQVSVRVMSVGVIPPTSLLISLSITGIFGLGAGLGLSMIIAFALGLLRTRRAAHTLPSERNADQTAVPR